MIVVDSPHSQFEVHGVREGRVVWSVPIDTTLAGGVMPAIAPDGTVYLHRDDCVVAIR